MAGFSGCSLLREPLAGWGGVGFGVVFLERLRCIAEIAKRREMSEVKSRQWWEIYAAWPRGRHPAEIRILTPRGWFLTKVWFRDTDLRTISRSQRCCNAAAVVIQVETRPINHILELGNTRYNQYWSRGHCDDFEFCPRYPPSKRPACTPELSQVPTDDHVSLFRSTRRPCHGPGSVFSNSRQASITVVC